MQAIETRYKGFRFRSRLEARWAVFFDCLGIQWVYESEGYELIREAGMLRYLPDFWLPEVGMFAEVKGDLSSVSLGDDYEKMLLLADSSQKGVLLLTEIQSRIVLIKAPSFGGNYTNWIGAATWGVCPVCMQWTIRTDPDGSDSNDDKLVCVNCWEAQRIKIRITSKAYRNYMQVVINRAIEVARSARFEHGEKPVIARINKQDLSLSLQPISIIKPKPKS